jgi:hypothetical protein
MPAVKTKTAVKAQARATPPAAHKTSKPATRAKAVPKPAAGKLPARKTGAVKVTKAAPVSATVAAPVAKPPKHKLVRDSFTIPRAEYEVLDAIKARLVKLTRPAKKSEVLRAGIAVLATLNDAALLAALEAVPAIKTGRPKKAK